MFDDELLNLRYQMVLMSMAGIAGGGVPPFQQNFNTQMPNYSAGYCNCPYYKNDENDPNIIDSTASDWEDVEDQHDGYWSEKYSKEIQRCCCDRDFGEKFGKNGQKQLKNGLEGSEK